MSFHKEVWEKLSGIDVNEHTDKKGNLTYLSWAWAWGELMNHYPASSYTFEEPLKGDDGTVEIRCNLALSDGENSLERSMWLPVMNHKNAAIPHPDARAISDTKMRCLTKAIAMCGLGHYIYAGEDLPQNAPPYTAAQQSKFKELFLAEDSVGIYHFRLSHEEAYMALTDSFEAGTKTANKKKLSELESSGCDLILAWVESLSSAAASADSAAVDEISNEIPDFAKALVKSRLSPEAVHQLSEMKKQAA